MAFLAELERKRREETDILHSSHLNINSSLLGSFQSELLGDLTFL